MESELKIDEEISTDLGVATVKSAKAAIKRLKCPLCTEEIELGEDHVLIVPKKFASRRRHAHRECYLLFKSNMWKITLIPTKGGK